MGIKRGSITTSVVADGLVYNLDAANRASTIPVSTIETSFNTINLTESGSFSDNGIFDSSTITPSFAFDGTNDYIDCGTISSFDDGDISFALWCNLTSNGTFQYILSTTNSSTVSGINIAINSSGLIHFERAQDVANTQNSTGYVVSGLSYGNWHHLCGTYNATSGELKAYVDGVLKSTTNNSADARSASTALKIGGLSASSSLPANGNISTIHIYNRALSANEVLHNFNALKGRFE